MGDNLDGTNDLTSGHGTACAGLAAGKHMGLAFEANIWNMLAISDNVGMTIERSYDYLKIWHRNKPTNPETGDQIQLSLMVETDASGGFSL